MTPKRIAEILYKRLLKRYAGVFFTDSIVYNDQDFLIIYVDDVVRSGFRMISEFKGMRVLLRSISAMLEPVENLQK